MASRFAAEILPGIFRLDDPCARLRLAPEGRLALKQIVESICADTFIADDALGWVYQHWQKERKDEVNASERKIGGADLAPVTQLFTENYMVRFLLENSLGAWWAGRHPHSPLVSEWSFLRTQDGNSDASSFDRWPSSVADVTVMDPCCGSGHFLVEAFEMLWKMREEEECLSAVEAQDAVLRENLYGVELDPRCVEIAMFAVALAAWKAGGGWRPLPVPNVACSGIPIKAATDQWKPLADGDHRLDAALARLHRLFSDADTLGSLIDPQRSAADDHALQSSLDDVSWSDLEPLLFRALSHEQQDPASAVLGARAIATARAAHLLGGRYTLVVTNPPYLGRGKQAPTLRSHLESNFWAARQDLATAFMQRLGRMATAGGMWCAVMPENWAVQPTYRALREEFTAHQSIHCVAVLGEEAFVSFGIRGPRVILIAATDRGLASPAASGQYPVIDVSTPVGGDIVLIPAKIEGLRHRDLRYFSIDDLAPGSRIPLRRSSTTSTLAGYADSYQGLKTGDDARFRRFFWELPDPTGDWRLAQGGSDRGSNGLHYAVAWGSDGSHLARLQGAKAWGRSGVAMGRTRSISSALYLGHPFFSEVAVIVPRKPEHLHAIRHFAASGELGRQVRDVDRATIVSNGTFLDVPFTLQEWQSAADGSPDGVPDPGAGDPTEWLFDGHPPTPTPQSLQVAVIRLMNYRWPVQRENDLEGLVDDDGIVCIPSVLGERTSADRLQELLASVFGGTWSPARAAELLRAAGSKKTDLDSWLRDEFFKAHCQVFKNRPFIWHVWDGRKDGFSALVNYHRLDRPALGRLAYTYLGDWIERQAAGAREDLTGAEERLIAARGLQQKLALIINGEPPYDIYVRWKPLAAQAVGWAPDLDDGVRLNVRPFVEAGVLRAKFNVKWEKDRGKNPDGSERHNNLHLSNTEKQAARGT